MIMSEAVKNRQNQRAQLRQIQQEAAERKRELAAQQREEMQNLKNFHAEQRNQEAAESAAAISYVNDEAEQVSDTNYTYSRNAKLSRRPEIAQQNYETRDTDEFYKIQDRGSQMSEESDGYMIEAYSPEYEKDQVRVTVKNNKAVVSGNRKFQDNIEEAGKKISTNNYQTFREEFQFGSPVAADSMTQERSGDYIRVFVPKLSGMRFSDSEES